MHREQFRHSAALTVFFTTTIRSVLHELSLTCASARARSHGLHGDVRGMIAGEVLFEEQSTFLSMLGALMICCVTISVTVYEHRSQEKRTGPQSDMDIGAAVANQSVSM